MLGFFYDTDFGSQGLFQLLNGGFDVRVEFHFIHALWLSAFQHLLRGALRFANRPSAGDSAFGNFALHFGSRERQKTPGVSRGKAALGDELLKIGGELQQADGIDDGRAIFTGAVADIFRGEIELGGHALEGDGRFDGVQILSLNVLDKRDFEEMIVGDVLHDNRNCREACEFRRAPAAFAGYKLVAVACFADNQGLNNAVGADGLRQFRQFFLLEQPARL